MREFPYLQKYQDWFHDGALLNVKRNHHNLELYIESADIEQDFEPNFKLIEERIRGVLILHNVTQLFIDNPKYEGDFYMISDDATIHDLYIFDDHIEMCIQWGSFINRSFYEYTCPKVYAEKIVFYIEEPPLSH